MVGDPEVHEAGFLWTPRDRPTVEPMSPDETFVESFSGCTDYMESRDRVRERERTSNRCFPLFSVFLSPLCVYNVYITS